MREPLRIVGERVGKDFEGNAAPKFGVACARTLAEVDAGVVTGP